MYLIQSDSDDGQVRYYWIPNMGDVYVVGNDGSVWSRYKGIAMHCYISNDWMKLKLRPNHNGYLGVDLCFKGVVHPKKVHQLVCEAVYGPCPVGMWVCHNDNNPANNNWWNLRYDTPTSNQTDRVIHGTDNRGERQGGARFVWIEVREMRAKWRNGNYTYRGLAMEYGVSVGCVYKIVNNLSWIEEEVAV
jgi:hypothetical protein